MAAAVVICQRMCTGSCIIRYCNCAISRAKIWKGGLGLTMMMLNAQALTLKYDMRFGLMGAALKLAGKKKLATLITKSWTVRDHTRLFL